jgi:hypothetical protein
LHLGGGIGDEGGVSRKRLEKNGQRNERHEKGRKAVQAGWMVGDYHGGSNLERC